MTDARNRLSLIGLIVLVGLGIAILMTLMPAGASQTGDTYPAPGYHGDWTIDTNTRVIDEVLNVDGNIIVNAQLELWNVTIWFDNVDDAHMLNVTTNGNLMANDTRITSAWSEYEYGFTVYGKMTLKRATIEETYGGVQVLTKNTVTIEDSSFLRSYGTGLYLEDADGTTVKNIQIQTNDLRSTATSSYTSMSSADYQQTKIAIGQGGALYVKDGDPTIEDVYVSANGTVDVTMTATKHGYYYWYIHLHIYFPVVGIDSADITDVSGIHVRDSSADFNIHYDLYDYWTMTYGYLYAYTYTYVSAVNVANYGDVTLSDCTLTNAKVGKTSITHTLTSTSMDRYTVYQYPNKRSPTLYGATLNQEYTTAGPHKHKLTVKDAAYEKMGVLTAAIVPDYNVTVDPTFRSMIVLDNISINKGSLPFSFNVGPQFAGMKTIYNDVRISNSTYTIMSGPLFEANADAGPGVQTNVRSFNYWEHIIVENCLFRWNKWTYTGSIYVPYQYKSEYNNLYDRHIHVRNNKYLDNTGSLGQIQGNPYSTRGREQFTFEGNLVQNNTHTAQWMIIQYRDTITLKDNRFIDNTWSYSANWYDQGGTNNGKKPTNWSLIDNYFEDTYISGGKTNGLFSMRYAGDLNVSGNNITGLETAFLFLNPYTYWAGYADLWFTENEWTNCNGTLLYFQIVYNTEDVTIYIDGNKGWNSNGLMTDFYTGYAENYDTDLTTYFTNNTIIGFKENSVFRCYEKVIVTGNTFIDCTGYVIHLEYLGQHSPTITNNNIIRCDNVYYIGAKDRGVLKMSLQVSDLNVDCTGTAFYFKNVDVTMERVEISPNVLVAIIADNSNVDALSSTIPIGSGLIIGTGEINVWFEFEMWVEWSNLDDPDTSSGVPVDDALVVLYGFGSTYYTSAYTDAEGHLKTVLLPQWTMRGSFLTVWTPFTVGVAKAGVTTTYEFPLNKSYSGPDAIHLLLSDIHIPVIRITTPFNGATFNTENITMHGFSTEVGSGIGIIQGSIGDEDEWIEVEFDLNGDFFHTFSDLPEGTDIPIKAKVNDVALNFNETMVMVTIDMTPPRLVVITPEDDAIYNEAAIVILGEYEPGSSIPINGLEKTGTSGILSENYTLSEGRNTIVVVATDPAGNQAMITRSVKLDRFAPTLTVLAPRNNLVTRITKVMIDGDVEIGADITVSVYRSETDTIDEPITPRDDGTFSHEVSLEEGENVIVVTAVDDADNPAMVTRIVYVDTTAPMCQITSPNDGSITNVNTVRVLGTAETVGVTLYLDGKQIHNDGTVDRVVNLNEGPNVIELRAVDVIGNVYSDRVTITLDTVPPKIEMNTPTSTNIMTNNNELRLIGTVAGFPDNLRVMDIAVPLTDEGKGIYSFDTTITLPKEGVNDVLLVARDTATNLATHSISVDYSTERPDLFITFKPTTSEIKGENPNFYITGLTTPGIASVKVTHTVGGTVETATAPVAGDGSFSIARTLSDGANTFMVEVTDAYGNINSTADYTVSYTYQRTDPVDEEISPFDAGALALWFLAIAVALFLTVVIVTRMMRKD